jgi:hypothetical protein
MVSGEFDSEQRLRGKYGIHLGQGVGQYCGTSSEWVVFHSKLVPVRERCGTMAVRERWEYPREKS